MSSEPPQDSGQEHAFEHWCEECGRTELLTPQEAYEQGWDFPPRMGQRGVISPRTCGSCPITATVWWVMAIDKATIDDLTPGQRKVIARILHELPAGQENA